MKPVVYNAHYLVNPNKMDFSKPVEIHFSRFGDTQFIHRHGVDHPNYTIPFLDTGSFKVFCNFTEPTTSENIEKMDVLLANHEKYDLILTSNDEVIENCKNAVFFPYGTTWLHKELDDKNAVGHYDPSIDVLHEGKDNSISFLITGLRGKHGYELRHGVWRRKNEIENKRFYSSTRSQVHDGEPLPDDDKKHLFKSKFSIVIESSKEENYFTEKICDAFLAKTIPIYWGCPNVDNFFNTDGIIICETEDEIIEACKMVESNPEIYDQKKTAIDENFEKAKEFCRPLEERISEIVNEKIETFIYEEGYDCLLTIGILSLPHRKEYLDRLLDKLNQIGSPHVNKVKVIIEVDNGEKSVGEKRNSVLSKATGKYVCFIDDDDMVHDNYLNYIVQALEQHPEVDTIGFKGLYHHNGTPQFVFDHSSRNGGNFQKDGVQYRNVNHLNPVRTSIAREIGFPEKNFGEDSDYSDILAASGKIKGEVYINDILYHYLFDRSVTNTQ